MTTRSGLVASSRKHVPRTKKTVDINSLLPCAITRRAPFSLKPFADIYNPYHSKGCSVLCNHPRSSKHSWPNNGQTRPSRQKVEKTADLPDHVPEEFFRRYTDTDSRPLTPTPSCATSARTRTGIVSSHLSTRRCVTPEPVSNNDNNERKQIILDLRRSHSQETLYWNASSDLHQDSTSLQSHSIRHEIEIVGVFTQKEDIEDIQELEEEEVDFDVINETEDIIDPTTLCINARDDAEDELFSRRGKLRRKKSKTNVQMITFQPNNEPETQVAQVGSTEDHDPDSPNLSERPSLIPDASSLAATPMPPKSVRKPEDFYVAEKSLFLDEDALKTLRMGLNVDIVECVFERYRHRTLQEVLRTISPDKMGVDSDAVADMREYLNLEEIDYEKWMHLPRKFSRASARFELPMDLKELVKLTPLVYFSKFVCIEDDKKQLYHRIFVKYLPKENRQENDNEEFFIRASPGNAIRGGGKDDPLFSRFLPVESLTEAINEVLGFHATEQNVPEIIQYLELDTVENVTINFRTFSGIVSFAERLITTLDQEEDPRNEIEIADFETLARSFDKIECKTMKTIFNIIQK